VFIFIPTYKDRAFILRVLKIGTPEQIRLVQTHPIDSKYMLTHGRLEVYTQAAANFMESPLFGQGLGNLRDFDDLFSAKEMFRSHNLILDLLGQTGIFGFLIYASLMLLIMQKLWLRKSMSAAREQPYHILPAIFFASLGVLIHSMFEPNFMSFKFDALVWMFLAFAVLRLPEIGKPEFSPVLPMDKNTL